jgi:hypothetical protein
MKVYVSENPVTIKEAGPGLFIHNGAVYFKAGNGTVYWTANGTASGIDRRTVVREVIVR